MTDYTTKLGYKIPYLEIKEAKIFKMRKALDNGEIASELIK